VCDITYIYCHRDSYSLQVLRFQRIFVSKHSIGNNDKSTCISILSKSLSDIKIKNYGCKEEHTDI